MEIGNYLFLLDSPSSAHPVGTAKATEGGDGDGDSVHPWAVLIPQEEGQERAGQEIPAPLQAELSQINPPEAVL